MIDRCRNLPWLLPLKALLGWDLTLLETYSCLAADRAEARGENNKMHCKQALLPRARGVGWRHATNYTPVLAQQPVAGRVARLRKAHTSSTAARSSVRAIKRSSDAGVSSASSAFSPADLSHERTNAVSQQVDHTLQQHHQQQDAQLPGGILLLSLISAAGGVLGSGFSLEGPWSVAEALGVLAAIITVHECGHFLAARSQGIHVTEFSIGFGPQIWKRKVCVICQECSSVVI